jgi:1-acyl-sn-glycerol-3-phosphate acyltransferase
MKALSERWLRLCYAVLYLPVVWLAILLFSTRIRGREHLPRHGAFVALANHESFLDPILIALAIRRPVWFLARRTLFEPSWFGRLIAALGAVPLEREGLGVEGLRAGLRMLQEGRGLLIFPEGTRTRDGQVQPFKPGILLLLRRTRVPVVPIALAGPFHAMPKGSTWPRVCPLFLPGCRTGGLACVIGKPIPFAAIQGLPEEQVLGLLRQRIIALKTEAEALRRKPQTLSCRAGACVAPTT